MALASLPLRALRADRAGLGGAPAIGRLAAVPAFFLFRMASALLLLKLSTSRLDVAGFTFFSQFMLFTALLNLVAIGGAQNGLIRQAAAADDAEALGRVWGAALAIWATAAPALTIAIAAASRQVSHVLIGSAAGWPIVIAVVLLALGAGPGQIWCSLLSGRKHVTASLLAQALGLLASTALAAALLIRGDPRAAVIGFASGPLVTMAIAFLAARRLDLRPPPSRARWGEVRLLLRYSLAFAATTGFSAILLFALRSLYRSRFGTAALGYWLVANRISDMSTQLLGLFLIQVFVPHVAMLADGAARRRFLLRCWATAFVVMGSAPLLFSLAPRRLVHIFLSDAFLPAIPAIRLYMIGDTLRVWVSLAMYAAFAQGRPGRYAAIEIATLSAMAVITVFLMSAGEPQAPMLGYALAYGLGAVAATVAMLRGRASGDA